MKNLCRTPPLFGSMCAIDRLGKRFPDGRRFWSVSCLTPVPCGPGATGFFCSVRNEAVLVNLSNECSSVILDLYVHYNNTVITSIYVRVCVLARINCMSI